MHDRPKDFSLSDDTYIEQNKIYQTLLLTTYKQLDVTHGVPQLLYEK